VKNETIKILKKKRFLVIVLILVVLIPMFTYAQYKAVQERARHFQQDWRLELQQRITDLQNSLGSDRVPEEWKRYRRILVQQLQYYLDHDVNPSTPDGVTFTRTFMENATTLFVPLLVMAVASDIVSAERSSGTIKMLLTRPVRRWKILLSKLITLMMFISLIVVTTIALTYLISGLIFGYGGWRMPIFTGFVISGTEVDESRVHAVPQWMYMLMQAGLIWFSAVTVGCLAFMVSVLLRSTAASIVTMMAAIIAGSILTNMTATWKSAKYLFMVNLRLTDYLSGSPPPIEGMTLAFSLTVLAVWAAASIFISFRVFTSQDILN
jgi:ABC-2 type transport system permease protein